MHVVDGAADRQQIILPRSIGAEFIRLVHSGMTGGHMGRQNTEEQVQRRAYWPRWRSDVAWELKKCPECAQYRRGQPPKQTFLQPFNAGERFEAIDRHPKSARVNVNVNVGQWVWYLIPRKFVGRYPKWTRNCQGPYLVVRVISPSDYMIQRHRRAVPIVVHGDKLKVCYGDHPAS